MYSALAFLSQGCHGGRAALGDESKYQKYNRNTNNKYARKRRRMKTMAKEQGIAIRNQIYSARGNKLVSEETRI